MMSNPFFPRLNPALLNGALGNGAALPPVSSAGLPQLPPTHPLMAHLHRMNNQRMMGDPRVPTMPLGLPRFGHFSHNGKIQAPSLTLTLFRCIHAVFDGLPKQLLERLKVPDTRLRWHWTHHWTLQAADYDS